MAFLGFCPELLCPFGGILRQALTTAVIYSPLVEYHGTTAKFGPLAKSETCTPVRGLLDKIFTHLIFIQSGADGDVCWLLLLLLLKLVLLLLKLMW